jgi:hypothetical protein
MDTYSQSGLHILQRTDIEEAAYFWQAVLRREITGNVTYSRQRDHFAHTLYNYLMGWYFFS